MIAELIKDKEFLELEKEYKFLSRARGESIDALNCIILDIETTGLEPTKHELTEIGAIKACGKELKEIFSTLILPQNPISEEITRLTGIDDEMVKDFPPAKPVLNKFSSFIEDHTLIAHNADFDLGFIKHHFKQHLDLEINNSIVCTVKLARYLFPGLVNHKLHTVASHLGFKVQNRHRAMGDAELTYQVWIKVIDLLKEKNIYCKRDLDALLARL